MGIRKNQSTLSADDKKGFISTAYTSKPTGIVIDMCVNIVIFLIQAIIVVRYFYRATAHFYDGLKRRPVSH